MRRSRHITHGLLCQIGELEEDGLDLPDPLSLDLEPAKSIDGVIAQLIGIIFQAQLEGEWPRLKICASDECRWAFFDSSRNRGGTWCQMEICGNRIKNRAYRRRKSARPAPSEPV